MKILPLMGLFLTLSFPVCANAQANFDKAKKEMDEKFEKFQNDTAQAYDDMERRIDAEFADMLNRTWLQMEIIKGRPDDTTPKPDKVPVARPTEKPAPREKPSVPTSLTSIAKAVKTPIHAEKKTTIDFYSTPVEVAYDPAIIILLNGALTPQNVSLWWKSITATNFTPIVEQMRNAKKTLRLNDWEYRLLLGSFANAVYGNIGNDAALMEWFLLIKSGYDARIGLSGERIYLLLATKTVMYNTDYYTINGSDYYLAVSQKKRTQNIGLISTYEGTNQTATGKIDLAVYYPPDISSQFVTRNLIFSFKGETHTIIINVNRNLIMMLEQYPQTEFPIFYSAPVSSEVATPLLNNLKKLIDDKTEGDAVNMLLSFVQNAFTYKTDDAQFGREKFMFPEETIYYPASDCEDRAVLFAFLVRNLLGLEVLGLHYPGHMATAVKFSTPVAGDKVIHAGQNFTICDPTYINANYGESMKKFKVETPKIIEIR